MPNPNWWEAYPWPPPMHQPFAKVLPAREQILAEAALCVRLVGLEPATTHDALLTQMDELVQTVGGYRFQTALRRLREHP